MNDISYALRQLAREPAVSALVVLMLAVGIGATTAIFSSFQTILLRPLPVPAAERLVNLSVPGRHLGSTTTGAAGNSEYVFSYPMFRDLEARQTSFTGIAGHVSFSASLSHADQAQAGTGMLVSGNYFDALNLRPALGRLIGPDDEPQVGEAAVTVLSYRYWISALGGDPDILGQTLTVNDQDLTVVGVAPPAFSGTTLGTRADVFVPLTLRWQLQPTAPDDDENRFAYWLYLFARLKPGVSIEQARASLDSLHHAIVNDIEGPMLSEAPATLTEPFLARHVVLEPGALGQSIVPDHARLPLTLLLGLTGLVLLIVCINIANLLLARGVSRAGEIAVRKSLGATEPRLIRQLLIEGGVLAVLGGALSLPIAPLTLSAIGAMSPEQLANDLSIELNGGALLFAVVVTLSTLLLFGLIPALQAAHADPGQAAKTGASRTIGRRGAGRIRGGLASAQSAFSMALLVLAGLFAQSLGNVARVDLGMNVDRVVTFDVSPRPGGYDADEAVALAASIEDTIGAQPGVSSVASSWVRLLIDDFARGPVGIVGAENLPGADTTSWFNAISPGYFRTLSIRLLAGREFTQADSVDSPAVAVVNESFVRKFDLGNRAVGTHFSGAGRRDQEIVGVVADAKYADVKGEIPPQYYVPQRQYRDFASLTFYVRSEIEPEALMRTIPRVVAGIDPGLPVYKLKTMRRTFEDNVYLDRMIATLSVFFAVLAVLLAAIGLYGVLAYSVSQRTRELGLRQALGATPGKLITLVLTQAGLIALAGVSVGLGLAAVLGRIAESLLYGLSGAEPAVFVAAAIVLSLVLVAAGLVPARRASRVSPMQALREE